MPGNTKSNFSYMPRKQTEEISPITALFFTEWTPTLSESVDTALEQSLAEEEEAKPSLPILDWNDEELPF